MENRNVFISHYGKDNDQIARLKYILKRRGFNLRDSSVSSKSNKAKNEDYIKQKILKPKINWAGQLIVLIGPKTHSRKYVNWEIEQAHKQGKNITGIYLPGAIKGEYKLPENFEKYGTALTPWSADPIIRAISGKSNSFQNPDGSHRSQSFVSSRSTC